MKRKLSLYFLSLVLATSTISCATAPSLPNINKATFDGSPIDNPFFPLKVGSHWEYEATSAEGVEHIDLDVLETQRLIQGIVATVVHDAAHLDGALIEDTLDYYAQDTDGNVWYLGEESCVYEDNVCITTEGSWEYGVDGALPGIQMKADPVVDGKPYRQEFYPGHAEDVGEVIKVDQSIDVTAGSFTDCIHTHDTSMLDTALNEEKVYCSGIGFVAEPDENMELITYSGL